MDQTSLKRNPEINAEHQRISTAYLREEEQRTTQRSADFAHISGWFLFQNPQQRNNFTLLLIGTKNLTGSNQCYLFVERLAVPPSAAQIQQSDLQFPVFRDSVRDLTYCNPRQIVRAKTDSVLPE